MLSNFDPDKYLATIGDHRLPLDSIVRIYADSTNTDRDTYANCVKVLVLRDVYVEGTGENNRRRAIHQGETLLAERTNELPETPWRALRLTGLPFHGCHTYMLREESVRVLD